MKYIVFTFFVSISIINNLHSQSSTKWELYSNNDYRINYPSDWNISLNGELGTNFIIKSPFTSLSDDFNENVNLIIQNLSGYNLTLDEYQELTLSQIENLITDAQLLSNKRRFANGKEYHTLIYTGRQGVYTLYYKQYFWIIGEQAVILTFTCKNDEINSYLNVANEIMNSFKFN